MVKILCTPVTAEISSGRTSQRAQETQLASQNIRRIFHFEVFHHFVESLCSSLTCRAIFYLIIKFYKFKITWRIFPAQHSSIALFNVRWIRYFSCELQEEMRRSEVFRRFDLHPLSPASFLFSSQKTNVSKPSSSILLQNWCSLCSLFLEVHKNLIFVLRCCLPATDPNHCLWRRPKLKLLARFTNRKPEQNHFKSLRSIALLLAIA